MKLHEGQNKELEITMVGNEIIVKTRKDVSNDTIKKQQTEFIINSLVLLVSGIALGICITYLTIKN
tara:strand:- start:194 stop:391 length:198 start_codon:yes stop_codon:yes gene_type:complete